MLRHLKSVNDAILKFCLIAPSTAEPFKPFRIEEEMTAFDTAFPPLPQQEAVSLPEPRSEGGVLKGIARARYGKEE